jgi:hypothetical protein
VTTPAELGASDRVVLETVLRDAPIGVVVLDGELRIDCASRVAEADGPLTPADAGRRLFEAWPRARRRGDRASPRLRPRIACGDASESPDWRADRMTISAVTDAAGVVKHVIWMWSDASGHHARNRNGLVARPRLPRVKT